MTSLIEPKKYDFAFRFDANKTCGAGHFMRCFALIEVLLERGFKLTVCGELEPYYTRILTGLSIPVVPTQGVILCHCAVVDCYGNVDEMTSIFNKDVPVVLFEDLITRSSNRPAIVVDALGDRKELALQYPHANVMTGLGYFIFRKDIERVKYLREDCKEGVLVCLGGSTQMSVLQGIVDMTHHFYPNECITVFCDESSLEPLYSKYQSESKGNIQCRLFSSRFLDKARQASLVVCAAGQTLFEMLYCNIPVVGFVIAENQVKAGKIAQTMGASVIFDFLDSERLKDVFVKIDAEHASLDTSEMSNDRDGLIAMLAGYVP